MSSNTKLIPSSSKKIGLLKKKHELPITQTLKTTIIRNATPSSIEMPKKKKTLIKTQSSSIKSKTKKHQTSRLTLSGEPKSRGKAVKISSSTRPIVDGHPKSSPLAVTSGVKKLSIQKAKATREQGQKREKLLDQVSHILTRCQTPLETLDRAELKQAMEELQNSFDQIAAPHEDNDTWEEKFLQIRKVQAAFKRKLDKLTTTIKTVGLLKDAVSSLKEDSNARDYKTSAFRKRFCIALKYNFDPLFHGSIGTEGSSNRTEAMNNNLSKTVWDSKTSKPITHSSR